MQLRPYATPEAMMVDWADRLAGSEATCQITVAEESGRLVGFTMATRHGDLGELNAIHVHPDHHGSGVATGLHNAILDVMRGWGCSSTYLWVLVGNERAQAFYRRLGWTFDGSRASHQIGGADADILRYARPL